MACMIMPCCDLLLATKSLTTSTLDKMAQEHTTSLKVGQKTPHLCVTAHATDKLAELFTMAGYQVIENKFIHKETTNIKEELCVPRVFVQGKYCKSAYKPAE